MGREAFPEALQGISDTLEGRAFPSSSGQKMLFWKMFKQIFLYGLRRASIYNHIYIYIVAPMAIIYRWGKMSQSFFVLNLGR